MMNRVWRKTILALLGSLLLSVTHVQAASLEKIEVASKLGESFYAEVPLKLEANELVSKVFVEIAAAADYKIFEVYRDPVLNSIRADVASDERGARVELSSRSGIKAPFFNLVLKIRYGRVSHFKKYPVFLDSSKAIRQAAEKQPQPSVQAVKQADSEPSAQPSAQSAQSTLTESAGKMVAAAEETSSATESDKSQNTYFDGWARTGRYGPIVSGDSLSTVAERLRIDYRYTRNQIMLALFEKNRGSFEQDNINLLKADSFLDVPKAGEIEKYSVTASSRIVLEHEKNWQQLREQPRYAAAAEAQRTRYTKRVSIGKQADGVAAVPLFAPADRSTTDDVETTTRSDVTDRLQADSAASVDAALDRQTDPKTDPKTAPQIEQIVKAQNETNQLLAQLQEQNNQLQQQLIDNRENVVALNQKVDDVATAASKARIEKLEILMTRLQAELEKDRSQPASSAAAGSDWVLWVLIGLVIILLGIVAVLMRREPAHPAVAEETAREPATDQESAESEALAAAIEDEVAGIETGEVEIPIAKETATIDAMPAFTDALSDTDTAELEPFDADAEEEPDPNVDYMSEADVYIRYGMDDEALQQLDMALKQQPDNVEAHIKKAELLLGKSDRKGFDETIAAATLTLAAIDLDRFKSSIDELGSDIGEQTIGLESGQADAETEAQDTLPLDESETEGLDFDLPDMDGSGSDAIAGEDANAQLESGDINDIGDMDWLHDAAFDDDEIAQAEAADVSLESSSDETLQLAGGATQHLNNLLGEFPGDETRQISLDEDRNDSAEGEVEITDASTVDIEAIDVDAQSGATQELDSLLTEFSNVDAAQLDAAAAGDGATQHLDNLLSEFDIDEDEVSFTDTHGGFDADVIEQGKAAVVTGSDTMDSIGIDTDHGATQELDSLLAEFSNEAEPVNISDDEGLGESFFEPVEVDDGDNEIGIDTDHGATQELDNLLSEFSDEEDDQVKMDADQDGLDAGSMDDAKSEADDADLGDSGQGATQVLGHLLDEFKDDEDNKKG